MRREKSGSAAVTASSPSKFWVLSSSNDRWPANPLVDSRTATSGLDRLSARATWGRADIRSAGSIMPAPRLRLTRMRCHRTKDLGATALNNH